MEPAKGVEPIKVGVTGHRILMEEDKIMARMEHERWVEERRAEGWRYRLGPKVLERKTSPYLMPWEELPEDVKEYDRETVRAMPAFLKEAGFQVYRPPSNTSPEMSAV